ncbi:TPA: hypothetical protein PNM72_000104 [Listeria monocytogenes]|uniref:Uncharacterized protein n=2 Tax=Listeria monocytogenes TaxID=1639 RepID=A0A3V3AHA6_LISMN|nr:hypothetical protein [Listeria monocytogenes]ACK40634.1 conserved hypothetical protein [Listeria monocytogenes HCC23]ADB67130.1 hypothetical protein LM5578_0374 [Listeria monocytogenes 08-5578]ADB70219.1 hypothetical protein LM5923_0373 [Listeria monocytogenes 08-5923]AEH91372.1 hypothetical protein LMM7_0366 [Listeria monocytogenes M7]AHF31068.1 hypothetical protein A430_0382 [Listeria monocytogenes serotype 1/2a str. 08-6569]AHF34059.1 hypothetical protein A431_0382 [Listeria monocytogen
MKKLTTEQSFEYYLSSLCMLGMHTINLSDEEIEYEIFEELAIDYPAALSPYTRELLVDNDIIDRELSLLSKQLQTKLFELDGGILWNVKALRTTPEWKEVLRLSDEIKGLIHQQWTDEELDYLLGK